MAGNRYAACVPWCWLRRATCALLVACSAPQPPSSEVLRAASLGATATPAAAPVLEADAPRVDASDDPKSPRLYLPDEGVLVADMPELALARAAWQKGEWLKAEAELERTDLPLSDNDRGLAHYVLATEALARNVYAVAKRSAKRAERAGSPLAPHAVCLQVEAALGLDDVALARADLERVPVASVDARTLDDMQLRVALRSRDADAALGLLERMMVRKDPGARVTVLKVGRSAMSPPNVERASRLARLAQHVFLQAPSGRGAAEAKLLVQFATDHLDRTSRKDLFSAPPFDPVSVATGLVQTNRAREAARALERVSASCATLALRGDALAKLNRTSEAAERYGEAVEACKKENVSIIETLFAAGKMAARGGLLDKADAWLGEVEKLDAAHRLSDDARLESAKVAKRRGDLVRFDALLSKVDSDFPRGDVVGDAMFELALTRMETGAGAAALEVLRRGAVRPVEATYTRMGRFWYFVGAAEQVRGNVDAAMEAYQSALAQRPYGYYGAIAYAALEALSPHKAQGWIKARDVQDLSAIAVAESDVGALPWLIRAGASRQVVGELFRLGIESRRASPAVLAAAATGLSRVDPIYAHRLLRTADEVEASADRLEFREHLSLSPRRVELYRVAYPMPFAGDVKAAATDAQIDPAWLWAIMREESAFDAKAVSRAKAIGLMQLLVPTASQLAGRGTKAQELEQPAKNVALGAKFFAQLLRKYGGVAALAVAAYNAGPGRVDTWCSERPDDRVDLLVERIPFAETRSYVKRVLTSYAVYSALTNGHLGDLRRGAAVQCPAR